MKHNLDYKLNHLILKYGIYGDYKKFVYKMDAIKLIYEKLDCNKKILVISSNKIDIEMFFSTLYIRQNDYIQGSLYEDCWSRLDEYDQIWNVDLEWNSEKYNKLKQSFKKPILNLYEVLSNAGLHINWNFYNIFEGNFVGVYGGSSSNYADIDWYTLYYDAKSKYDLEKNESNLKNLIFICLELKDFEQAFFYMKLSNRAEIKKFKEELEKLLFQLKEKTMQRNGNIIINWFDALDYGGIDEVNMPYLNECKNKSQFFSNAYASSPYTGAAINAMFAHITMLDDNGYKMKKISAKNSRLIRVCEEKGYIFRYYGMHHKSFSDEYLSTVRHYRSATTGQVNWSVLCDLYESSSPMLIIAHNLAETHPPFKSCFAEEYYVNAESISYKKTNLQECKIRGKRYVDKIQRWYNSFLVNENTMIYLSDHGDPSTLITNIWRAHINLFIIKKRLPSYVEDGNYSIVNFDILLIDVINDKFTSIGDYVIEMAEIQNCDLYSEWKTEAVFFPDKFDYKECIGYRGVVTEDAYYIMRNDGTEEYYNKFSCINTVSYQCNFEKVTKLREYVLKRKEDCNFNGIFPWTEKLYRSRIRYVERNGEKEKGTILLIEKLNVIPEDKIIAIRGGGIHTIELLNAIGSIGERISYIIDRDKSSAAFFKEFKVISPDDIAHIKIEVLIISSLTYREEFKKEVLEYPQEIEIIDVYDLLEAEGIFFDKGFYEPNYLECDFEE